MFSPINLHILWSSSFFFFNDYQPDFFFFLYARNHVKGHSKPEDVPPPVVIGSLVDGLSSPLSPQHLQTLGKPSGNASNALPSTGLKDTSPNGNLSRIGWAK